MAITATQPLSTKLNEDHVLINDDLKISFRRTIRVPDNHQTSFLPPDLGAYPLKSVAEHANKMRPEMIAKGGLMFPMYRRYHCNVMREWQR
jgi:hypothetical protein